jgi:hypothetical protein
VTLAACSPTTPTSSPSAGAHRTTSTPSVTASATPSVTETPTAGPAASNPASTAHQLPASTPVNEKSVSYEGITCAVTTDGVTCIEVASGHGFFISKTANDIF